jgi:hypothetical protein
MIEAPLFILPRFAQQDIHAARVQANGAVCGIAPPLLVIAAAAAAALEARATQQHPTATNRKPVVK